MPKVTLSFSAICLQRLAFETRSPETLGGSYTGYPRNGDPHTEDPLTGDPRIGNGFESARIHYPDYSGGFSHGERIRHGGFTLQAMLTIKLERKHAASFSVYQMMRT